jgi:hypothetical protein
MSAGLQPCHRRWTTSVAELEQRVIHRRFCGERSAILFVLDGSRSQGGRQTLVKVKRSILLVGLRFFQEQRGETRQALSIEKLVNCFKAALYMDRKL